ncbi:siderophore ABC transporter substrate-binding protein [Devosia sp. FKR38]|uniref:siderophore ABC transporter substrate-binding protein n=1 Tax=Devosia sp. FKR38 TaxID=2562312 RepID=UPI0010BF8304|nr:siderophore ABC transporter substrate-binding protein [Devosia sp. FKR38]
MKSLAILALSVALALAAPTMAEDIVVAHAQGETTIAQNPQKVITFDFASLDTLDALGVEIAGLPGSNLPEYLGKYADEKYLKVGTLFEPDYEAVAAAAPDLIIVAGRSAGAFPELAKIAPTIDLTNDWTRFEASIKDNSRILGEIFNKTAEVEAMIAALDSKVAAIKAKAPEAGTALVVLTNAAEVTAFGPGSRFGWLHDTLGLAPAGAKVLAETHGDVISFEYFLEANPDWLFAIDRDAATGTGSSAAILDNELVNQINAAKAGHVVTLDPVRSYIINGGLPAFTALVDQVGTAIGAF